jgi:hypothetical protein
VRSTVSVGEVDAADALADAGRDRSRGRGLDVQWLTRASGRRALWLGIAVVAVLALPLLVALVALHHQHWIPLLDMAETEIRVRDVWSSNPPLIGLAGRIGPFGPDGGSHPGPVSFFAIWPFWLLSGKSAYGMFVGTVALDVGAIALSIWMAFRRGGMAVALGIALVLAVVMRAYGAYLLTLPWNPYLPVLWWVVFLLAAWSLLAADFAMLPVAVFGGTMAMQTHISYVGLVGGLSVFLVAAIAWSVYQHRGDTAMRSSLLRWGVVSLGLGVVLWTPPMVDELIHTPGNLSTIRDYFSHPPADSPVLGLKDGISVMLRELNPLRLVGVTLVSSGSQNPVTGTRLPGVLLVVAWIVAVVVAWRLHSRALKLLNTVIGVALALGVFSSARILGQVWFYLLLWAWVLNVLMLFTIGWTVVAFVREHSDRERAQRLAEIGVTVLGVGVLVVSGVFVHAAAGVQVQEPRQNETLVHLVPPTVAALAAAELSGVRGPYLITWLPDPLSIGGEGYGLFNELIRHGYDVRAGLTFRPGATRFHILTVPAAARVALQVHIATGDHEIARWKSDGRFREVASFDPRSPAEREEFDRLRQQFIDELQRHGAAKALIDQVDQNLFTMSFLPNLPPGSNRQITTMLHLGMPSAVFVGPAGEPPNS